MRIKELFTVYPRKLKTATVFYYQCYDNNGERTCGRSTGQRTRTAAKMYCMDLYRQGKLLPDKKTISFEEFAAGWWNLKTCKYLEWRQVQNPLSLSTIDNYKTNLEHHIKPFFGKTRIGTISPELIQKWIMGLSQQGLSNASLNLQIAILRIMLKEAVRLKFIPANPVEKIKKLTADNKEVQILKSEEAHRLFPADWHTIWDSFEVYVFNKIAACTGMRFSEIIGLQTRHIHEDHIHVCVQYTQKYGFCPLKTKDSRDVPITEALYHELLTLIKEETQVFLFLGDSETEPISRNRVYKETGAAFDKIGIGKEERKKRRLALHHWRHFLNTALLMANISTIKVQKVTGHKSLSMTRHYAHFDSREFVEVLDVQNRLFG